MTAEQIAAIDAVTEALAEYRRAKEQANAWQTIDKRPSDIAMELVAASDARWYATAQWLGYTGDEADPAVLDEIQSYM